MIFVYDDVIKHCFFTLRPHLPFPAVLRYMDLVTNQKVKKLLTHLLLPGELVDNPPRYNDAATSMPSSLQVTTFDINVSWTSGSYTSVIPDNETQIFIFRDPARAVVHFMRNVGAMNYRINIDAPGGPTASKYVAKSRKADLSGGPAVFVSGAQPHGANLYPYYSEGRFGYWVDNDGTNGPKKQIIRAVFADPTNLSNAVIITQYVLIGKHWIAWNSKIGIAGTDTYEFDTEVGGSVTYLEVANNDPVNNFVVFSDIVYDSAGNGVYAHRSIPNMDVIALQTLGIRVLAGSITWMNESAKEYKSGRITSATIPSKYSWISISGGSSYVNTMRNFKSHLAAKGYFGFLPIGESSDLAYRDTVVNTQLREWGTTYISCPGLESSPYQTVVLSVNDSNARDTTVQISHISEYFTITQGPESRFSEYTPEEWTQAIQLMRNVPSHGYEDRNHIEELIKQFGLSANTDLIISKKRK